MSRRLTGPAPVAHVAYITDDGELILYGLYGEASDPWQAGPSVIEARLPEDVEPTAAATEMLRTAGWLVADSGGWRVTQFGPTAVAHPVGMPDPQVWVPPAVDGGSP